MKNVVFLDTVHPILRDRLTDFGFKCIDATSLEKKECVKLLHNAFGIVLRSRFRVDKEFLKDGKNKNTANWDRFHSSAILYQDTVTIDKSKAIKDKKIFKYFFKNPVPIKANTKY